MRILPRLILALALGTAPAIASAQDTNGQDTSGAEAKAEAGFAGDPLPEPVVTQHKMTVDDAPLAYRARVEMLELRDTSGTATARLSAVAYLADDQEAAERPVTFFMNGGPGAASAYLHVGGVGPMTLRTDSLGRPVDGGKLEKNPESWLAFTDLVFLDPVGTGFSRPAKPDDEQFYNHDADLESLADAIELWLDAQDRRASPVYLAGESYGGYRAAALPKQMMHDRGVDLAGTVLISPVIDFATVRRDPALPLGWAFLLPSFAATAAGHGRIDSPEADWMDPDALAGFALNEYVSALIHPEEMEPLLPELARRTGLEESFLRERRGRVGTGAFRERLLADEGRIVSAYDGLLNVPHPTPSNGESWVDPVLDGMTPAYVTGFLDYLRRDLDWREGRDYELLNRSISGAWSYGSDSRQGYTSAREDLQEVMALDPSFRVFAVHGETDLVTPWLATDWMLEQIDAALGGVGERLTFARYPGGHMLYMRPDSNTLLFEDAKAFYNGE